ncbi:MAG: MurR/RpiR family transcriptional regulator [Holophaga sp.]|nr:MurR/RpiR family transcriptional regulator [Holophaga sp.]
MTSPSSILASLRHKSFSSPGHHRLAEVILARLEDVPTWGIRQFADEAGISTAAVVRFAQGLGFTTFSEFRTAILRETRVRDLGEDRLLRAPQEASAIMMEVAKLDFRNIEHAIQVLDDGLVKALVSSLQGANHRVLVGHGISWIMAHHLAYILNHCGLLTVVGSPAEFGRLAVNLTPRDLLVAFSFPPYSRETLQAVQFARDRKIPVIAFSDGPRSPLAQAADLAVTVPGENLFYSHSLAAFSAIAHTLGTTIAHQDPEAALHRLHEAERINEGLFV